MSGPRHEKGYRNNLPVRLGADGERGRLYFCKNKFWSVKLARGEWVFASVIRELIQDWPGTLVSKCQECGMKFLCSHIEPVCPPCEEEIFGTTRRASEPPDRTPADREWDRRRTR